MTHSPASHVPWSSCHASVAVLWCCWCPGFCGSWGDPAGALRGGESHRLTTLLVLSSDCGVKPGNRTRMTQKETKAIQNTLGF